jgi:hypothetical protein
VSFFSFDCILVLFYYVSCQIQMMGVSNILKTIILQLVANQTPGYFANILDSTLAAIQTTSFTKILVMPLRWSCPCVGHAEKLVGLAEAQIKHTPRSYVGTHTVSIILNTAGETGVGAWAPKDYKVSPPEKRPW